MAWITVHVKAGTPTSHATFSLWQHNPHYADQIAAGRLAIQFTFLAKRYLHSQTARPLRARDRHGHLA